MPLNKTLGSSDDARLLVRCVDLWLVKALRGMMTDERNTMDRFFLTICCVLFAYRRRFAMNNVLSTAGDSGAIGSS